MRGVEQKLQHEIVSWLKINRVYVIKVRAAPGVPVGCPDIIGLYEGNWLAIEVKADDKAKFQPGQKQTLQYLKDGGNRFVYVVTPDTWQATKDELVAFFL